MAAFKKANKLHVKKETWISKFYYTDWDGTKKQKKKEGFKTKKEALAYERDFLDKVNSMSDMLFTSLVQHYYEYINTRLKATTIETKKHIISTKILPYFGKMKLTEIDPSTIMKWQNELISQGYSQTYLKTIHNQVSAIFNFAMKFYKHNQNPARICGSMGKKNADSMDFYTFDEFKVFIKAFEDDPVLTLIYEILFYTGIRQGELFALTPSDFDFEKNILVIDENYQRVKGETVIQSPKTYSSNRRITLPEFLFMKIMEYIEQHYNLDHNVYIFHVSKSHLGRNMTRGAKIANIKRIRVHDLRHSHASHLIDLDFSALIISQRLGHKDIRTTLQTYGHLYPNKDIAIANKLNDLFKGQ